MGTMNVRDPSPIASLDAAGFTWQFAGYGVLSASAGPLHINLQRVLPSPNQHARPAGWYVTCMYLNISSKRLPLDYADDPSFACRGTLEYLRKFLTEIMEHLNGDPKLQGDVT